MSDTPINYEAVLTDLESRRAKIDSAIEAIRTIIAQGGTGTTGPSGPGGSIAPDAFLKMSIPDATKKHLSMTRQKQSTQSLIDALEKGGLPKPKYTTVYSVLRRRQEQVGDIINMDGDWALAEWYPNYKTKAKAKEASPPAGLDLVKVAKEAAAVEAEMEEHEAKKAKGA
jgi:hypothetical protein